MPLGESLLSLPPATDGSGESGVGWATVPSWAEEELEGGPPSPA